MTPLETKTVHTAHPCGRTPGAAAQEGRLFARYLLRTRDIPPEAIERYEAGCAALFDANSAAEDLAVALFVSRRPWSLPYLDAAAGLFHPHALLRKKLFLMLAVLEAMPANASVFAPRPRSSSAVVLRLLAYGVSSAFKAALGVLLYPFARRAQ